MMVLSISRCRILGPPQGLALRFFDNSILRRRSQHAAEA